MRSGTNIQFACFTTHFTFFTQNRRVLLVAECEYGSTPRVRMREVLMYTICVCVVCVCVCLCMYIYCVCVCVCLCVCVCVCVCEHDSIPRVRMRAYSCTLYIYVYIYMYMYVCMYVYILCVCVRACVCVRVCEYDSTPRVRMRAGTQFTCFTCTKVQILTKSENASSLASTFSCQRIFTRCSRRVSRYSVYLLY